MPQYVNIHSLMAVFKNLANLSPVQAGYPGTVYLEPSNRCNLSCRICARNQWRDQREGDMDMTVFRMTLPYLRKARYIRLHGHGEPLMGINFWRILKRACKFSAQVSFNTNGQLIDEQAARKIVLYRPCNLNISVPDPSGIAGLGGTTLDEALFRSGLIIAAGKILGLKAPDIGLAVISTSQGTAALGQRMQEISKAGIKSIVLQPPVLWRNFPDSSVQEAVLDESLTLSRLSSAFGITTCFPDYAVFDDGKRNGDIISVKDDSDDNTRFTKHSGGSQPDKNINEDLCLKCREPWETLAIKWDGRIHACCRGFFENPYLGAPVGNLKDPWPVWNSPARILLRFRHAIRSYPRGCRLCPQLFPFSGKKTTFLQYQE